MNPLDALCTYFERLSADNLGELDSYYAADARFKDPFHEVAGVAAIRAILEHTFDKLPGARFRVTRRFPGEAGHAVILWEMDFTMPVTRQPATIRGATHLTFAADGKVTLHRDYWDAAEELYAKLPIIGLLMRGLRKKLSARGPS